MIRRSDTRERSFLLQGCLILLPVLLLGAVGLYALRQDRLMVTQEARQRAVTLANDLAERLGTRIANELLSFELTGNLWLGMGIIGGDVPFPGTPRSPDKAQDEQIAAVYANRLSDWQTNYPGVPLADIFPVQARLSELGAIVSPRDYANPPEPAAWLADLNAEPIALWDAGTRMLSDGSRTEVARETFQRFLETRPSFAARANAAFALLILNLESAAAAERVARLLTLARSQDAVLAPSGVSLASAVILRGIREAEEIGLSAELFQAIAENVRHSPSVLTPVMLANARQLAGKFAATAGAVEQLALRWQAQERMRGLARQFLEIARPASIAQTNLWLDFSGKRWLALARPSESHWMQSGQTLTNRETEIHFFAKAVLARAAEIALDSETRTAPDYVSFRVSILGEHLFDSASESQRSDAPLLSQASGKLRWANSFEMSKRSGQQHPNALPDAPEFAIEVRLADAAALHAQANRRALIFGAVITFAVAAALIGFVSARRSFYRQLRLNELKSNFVSSVSHELRAPIASVRLMAEGLHSGRIQDEGKRQQYFKFIVQECRRLTSLIENVLDFARIEQGRKEYECETTDVVALIEQTAKLMEPYAAERGVRVELAFSNDRQPVQAVIDGRAIQQALVNLIDNAVKHSPRGSTVTIGLDLDANADALSSGPSASAESEPAAHLLSRFTPHVSHPTSRPLHLWVEDRGPGIPAHEHERIFERFYRLGTELRRETEGVGIGLSIVKHIVEAHGGKVIVRSAPGQGSRFTIALPLKPNTLLCPES